MKIALVQFNPVLKNVDQNKRTVNELISSISPDQIDLLMLPEMCFTGYCFSSLSEIEPFLEAPETGKSCLWAKYTAERLNCYVSLGFPEIDAHENKKYNSVIMVNPRGQIVKIYRKHFLFTTDENWASEGPGFCSFELEDSRLSVSESSSVKIGLGICMDINPYQFKSAWTDFEFAQFHKENNSNLLLLHNNWLTADPNYDLLDKDPGRPCVSTLSYWFERLKPIIEASKSDPTRQVVVAVVNRTGVELDSTFVGSSCVYVIKQGKVTIIDYLSILASKVLQVEI